MKKIAVLLAAVAATFASCQKPVLDEPVEVKDTFTAFVEEFDSPTKTSMNSNKQQLWSAGDELAIFRGNLVADEYKLADECAGTTSGIFKSVSGGAAGTAVPCNVAYYPYAEGQSLKATEAGYELSVELPETQLYAQNSYGVGAFPMVVLTTLVSALFGCVFSLCLAVAAIWVLLSQTVWVDVFGNAAPITPFPNPGIVSIPLAFIAIWLFSVTDRSKAAVQEREAFTALTVRSQTGIGATSASDH